MSKWYLLIRDYRCPPYEFSLTTLNYKTREEAYSKTETICHSDMDFWLMDIHEFACLKQALKKELPCAKIETGEERLNRYMQKKLKR